MKHNRNILVPVLVGPAILAFSTLGADLSFHPAKGTSLTKTVIQTAEMSLDDMTISQNGQEIDPSMLGSVEMQMTTEQTVTFTDTYADVADGQAKQLRRTFDELASKVNTSMSNPMMGDMDMDVNSESELEGMTVKFTWDADADEYVASFADDAEGDAKLLEGLRADLDYTGFLPSGEVEKGATWDVDPLNMLAVLAPGGSLKLEPVDMDESMMGMGAGPTPSADEFLQAIEGSVKAEFLGLREGDGPSIAVIKLTFDITSASDLTDLIKETMKDMEMPEMEMEFDSFDMEFAYEGEGEIHWNVAAGHIAGFEISGEVTMSIDQSMNISMQGMEMAMEQSMTLSGSQSVNLSTSE